MTFDYCKIEVNKVFFFLHVTQMQNNTTKKYVFNKDQIIIMLKNFTLCYKKRINLSVFFVLDQKGAPVSCE